jgi:hypothetical protein
VVDDNDDDDDSDSLTPARVAATIPPVVHRGIAHIIKEYLDYNLKEYLDNNYCTTLIDLLSRL